MKKLEGIGLEEDGSDIKFASCIETDLGTGYINHVSELLKLPFDKQQSFIKPFNGARQKKLMDMVNLIKENAVRMRVT
ncbi:hypothetical protein [Paenibacillus cellulositrophicus]|uniref:hypothetical protein n=1 Tax=Paenibacillus cellulositrophicus TaxID=562959 RepID=UPI00126717E5|nr:hypothetical protein [Paenibacillus cellulositrophicus]